MRPVFLCSTLAASLFAAAASAELSPKQAWQYWKNSFEDYGFEVSATAETSPNAVTVEELTLYSIDGDNFSTRISMGDIRFQAMQDDKVKMILPASMPVDIRMSHPGEEAINSQVMVTFDEGVPLITFEGTPEDLSARYDIGAMRFELLEAGGLEDDETISLDILTKSVKGITQKQKAPGDETQSDIQNFGIGAIIVNLAVTGPVTETEPQFVNFNFSFRDMISNSEMRYGDKMDWNNIRTLLQEGLDMKIDGKIGKVEMAFKGMTEDLGRFEGRAAFDNVTSDNVLTARTLRYALASDAMEAVFSSEDLPIPVSFALQSMLFDFTAPSDPDALPAPARFALKLSDLQMDEAIWSLFDPASAFSRTPMAFELALNANVTQMSDFMDFAALEYMDEDDIQLAADQVTLENLRIAFSNSELEGKGNVALDFTTLSDVPISDGKLDFKATNIQELITSFTNLGIIPEDQIFATQMMLGMLTRPGEEQNTVVSEIEFKNQGEIYVNGQRMQ